MPTHDPIEFARCDDCNAIPVMALAWGPGGVGMLVLACDCKQNIVQTDVAIDETPPEWK